MSIEKSMESLMQMSTYTYDKMWDVVFSSLSNFSWGQEQSEKMMQTYIDQRKNNRLEAVKITEEILQQTKNNQEKISEIMKEGLKTPYSDNIFSEYFKSKDISEKLDDLEKKIDEFKIAQ